jgi:hypothetical protein
MAKFNNPLSNVKIASPCKANWDEMVGDDKKRFCGECKLNVFNLSGMSKVEAESLIMNTEGRLCVRFYKRTDGTVLTKDCPVGWQAIKRRVSQVSTAVFSLFVGAFTGLGFVTAFNQGDSNNYDNGFLSLLSPTPKRPVMGKIAYKPTPTPSPTPKTSPTPHEPMMGAIAPIEKPTKSKKN